MIRIFLLTILLLNLLSTKAVTKTDTLNIDFGLVIHNRIDTQVITITNHHKSTMTYYKSSFDSSFTILKSKAVVIEPGKSAKFKIVMRPPVKSGLIKSYGKLYFKISGKSNTVNLALLAFAPEIQKNIFRLNNLGKINILFDSTFVRHSPIIESEHILITYRFRNIDSIPIVIRSIPTNCGCITANFNPAPVPPGEYGTIKVSFNSNGKVGINNKSFDVNFFNGAIRIGFYVEVKPRN